MYPITYGYTGLQFGIATAETGIILVSFTRTVNVGQKEVRDQSGNIVGVGSYGPTATYSLDATYLFGSYSGPAQANVGAEVTLNNQQNTGGVSGGHIITKSVSQTFSAEDFVKVKVEAVQYPSI